MPDSIFSGPCFGDLSPSQESTTSIPAETPTLDPRLEPILPQSPPLEGSALDDSLLDPLPISLNHTDNQDLQATDDSSVPDNSLHSDLDIDVQLSQNEDPKIFQYDDISPMQDDDNDDIPPSDVLMESAPDILNDDSEPLPHESSQPSSSPSDALSSFRSTSPSSMPTDYSEPDQLYHDTDQTNEQPEADYTSHYLPPSSPLPMSSSPPADLDLWSQDLDDIARHHDFEDAHNKDIGMDQANSDGFLEELIEPVIPSSPRTDNYNVHSSPPPPSPSRDLSTLKMDNNIIPEVVDGESGLPPSRTSSPTSSPQRLPFTSPPRSRPEYSLPSSPPLDIPQTSPIRSSSKPLSTLPAPKRPTITGHKRQFKKLSTPFRTPQITLPSSPPTKKAKRESSPSKESMPPPPPPPPRKPADVKKRHRTIRASAQFKSPLTVAQDGDKPTVRMTPTIQSLERKVQILKRALKVKNDGDEQILQDLAKQWTEAGREVAWQLWDIVKENGNSNSGSWGADSSKNKRGFDGSWGWEEQGDKKKMKMDSWGWDETPVKTEDGEEALGEYEQPARLDDECEEKVDFTLGVMLRQFGIDPDTLGWNEEDGVFR